MINPNTPNEVAAEYEARIAGLKIYAATLAAERDALAKELAESKENHRIYYDAWVKSQKACAAAQIELTEIKAHPDTVEYGWIVSGSNYVWTGEWAAENATGEAKRCGGTCIATALYKKT